MLWINGPSDQKCFRCKTTEKTHDVNFKDKTFRGVLCVDCIDEEVRERAAAEAEEEEVDSGAESSTTRMSA